MADENELSKEEPEIADLLDKAMKQMVKLTGCDKDSPLHRALLTASILAILRAGGGVRWFGEFGEDEEKALAKLYDEGKEKLTVLIRDLVKWMNTHTNASGVGPTGPPPCTIPKSMAKKVKIP